MRRNAITVIIKVIIKETGGKVKEKQERKGSKKITSCITEKAQTIDGASFFCYHKCGKRDRDTMCGKWKITEKKRGVFMEKIY